MLFVESNKLEKVKRLEGFKNPEDAYDIEYYEDIKREIEQISPNIKELIEEQALTPEMKSYLNETRAFCNELSEEFRQKFMTLLEQYRNEKRKMSPKIVDYLLEKKFDLPNFTITHGWQAQELLEKYNIDVKIDEQNLLLIFQLPKPLAQFWWKGGADSWGEMSEDVQGTVIEWGHFYRELMPVVWETQGRYEDESYLNFNRINEVSEHEPKEYYYIWEIS